MAPSSAEAFAALKSRLAERAPARLDEPGRMQTSVAVILTPGPRGHEALLIRRALRAGDPWSGHIGLPGGRRERFDADLLATAVRETEEEVGVALASESLLGALDDLSPSSPVRPPLMIRPFAFGLTARPAARLSDEVSETIWMPLADLAPSAAKTRVDVRGAALEVDAYLPSGLVIWGLTYRILRGLLPLASP
jgi:8-oxo-dGTP pyrophosphatase MutT (NUDIX family)